jgi:uncharacterized membrane protein YdjX (TVP38/TMEM64 family)
MTAEAEPICPRPGPAAEAEGDPATARVHWRNLLLLALGAGVLLTVVYLSPLRHLLTHWQEMSQYIRGFGILAPLVLTVTVAVLVSVGFPRLLFCVIAGMALGFWSGLFWTQLGTLMGNYITFTVARRGGRAWAERFLARRGKLKQLLRQEGVSGVILARQLPVPGLLINLACGLFCSRQRDFLIGTVIGQLPEAIPCTLIGAGILQSSFKRSFGLIALAVVAVVVAWLGLRWFMRVRTNVTPVLTAPSPSRKPE